VIRNEANVEPTQPQAKHFSDSYTRSAPDMCAVLTAAGWPKVRSPSAAAPPLVDAAGWPISGEAVVASSGGAHVTVVHAAGGRENTASSPPVSNAETRTRQTFCPVCLARYLAGRSTGDPLGARVTTRHRPVEVG